MTTIPADDNRPTSASQTDTGRVLLEVSIVAGVAPSDPIVFSLDGRPSESIQLPKGSISYYRTYSADNGQHLFAVSLQHSNCSINGLSPAADSLTASTRFTLSPGGMSTIYVTVDCSSVLTSWGATDTVSGAHQLQQVTVTLSSVEFGSRDVNLEANNRIGFGALHVGWYHVKVTGIPTNCWGTGLGVPIPFGWVGATADSIRIGGTSGMLWYTFTCS